MAGKKVAVTKPSAKELAKADDVLAQLSIDAGKGTSRKAEDNAIPLIYILQKNSPQVDKRGPDYVKGAEASDIWVRNHSDPIIKGEDGMLFQPCAYFRNYVEWVPRNKGGGYVAAHVDEPSDVEEKPHPENDKRTIRVRKNGNEVKETRYHIGNVIIDGKKFPYVIPMSGSGNTVSRNWMPLLRSVTVADVKKKAGLPIVPADTSVEAASWCGIYRLKTKLRKNSEGEWYTWDITLEDYINIAKHPEDYEDGKRLFMMFDSGEKVVEQPQQNDEPAEGSM